MSKHYQTPQIDSNQELQVALLTRDLLNEAAAELPAHIKNRLENARKLAVAAKLEERKPFWSHNWVREGFKNSNSTGSDWRNRAWGAFGAAPILALAFGIVLISNWQQDERILDIAKVDSAILVDVVPPHAYKDDGFVRYLITNGKDLAVEEDEEEEKI
ncbi:DUF3619 family protein [Polynucleobacter sp. MWH-CaK5]|uniref:DUF3619 family protein n=1 Tax=Polynucleobacter sp. MWH-CaK5 TaxID=2689107 RepID=UPI001BFED8D4|nr:DUF3619 family protein [Polynucleobacter sp. MWH-CaK5]QWD88528.1 DUF3619 family protein [Polynucleobacter sp. MWH-CaK5]